MAHPGEVIAKWMEAHELSENELARRTNIPQPTIHRIITGESRQPTRSKLEKLAKYFGCSVEDLYDKKANPGEIQMDRRAEEFASLISSLTEEQYKIVLGVLREFRKQAP